MTYNPFIKFHDTIEYTVRDPLTDEDTTWKVTLAGPAHEKTIKHKNSLLRRGLKAARLNQELVTEENADHLQAEGIVARIIGWEGSTFDFDPDQATNFFASPQGSVFARQLKKVLDDDARFIVRSETT